MLGALARFGGLGHMRWPNLEGSAFGLAQLFLFFFFFFFERPRDWHNRRVVPG